MIVTWLFSTISNLEVHEARLGRLNSFINNSSKFNNFYVISFELAIVSQVWFPCKGHGALSGEEMKIHQVLYPASGLTSNKVLNKIL